MYEFTEDELIELEFLRDLETDALVEAGHLPEHEKLNEALRENIDLCYPEMELRVSTGAEYPAVNASFYIVNLSLPRVVVDDLRASLRRICDDAETINCTERWSRRYEEGCGDGVFEAEMVVLKLADETKKALEAYRKEHDIVIPHGTDIRSVKWIDEISSNPLGIDAATVADTCREFLGCTPQEVCAMVPNGYRVLHCETVLRKDLAANFLRRREKMFETLKKKSVGHLKASVPHEYKRSLHGTQEAQAEELARYLCEPKLTFHGTQTHYVGSIVRHGFLLPGKVNPETGESHAVRCGSTYGRGIYSSPDFLFSMSYSGSGAFATKPSEFSGLKMIVCATLMGRTAQMFRDDNWRLQTKPYEGADSHVGNSQYEYIVFDNSQIIPCYVLHLDWGSHEENLKYFENLPEDPSVWAQTQRARKAHTRLSDGVYVAPGDKQRTRQALMAKAAKYFPYGYGPASGTTFVIEDVADVSEDEEDYGEFSHDRAEGVDIFANEENPKTSFWNWDPRGGLEGYTAVDQYSDQRIAKEKRPKVSALTYSDDED